MGCFCNIFENSTVWLIIIALILLFFFCGNDNYGLYNNNGCGCGCNGCGGAYNNNNGCGCGCN